MYKVNLNLDKSEIEAYGKNKAKADALTVLIMPPTQRIQRVADKTKKEVLAKELLFIFMGALYNKTIVICSKL